MHAALITCWKLRPGWRRGTAQERLTITDAIVRDALQKRILLYDKTGEEHYNLISALHKSVRNSDPDAALYWLGRMLEAGEDPLYVARRVVRMAVEDIGLADPNALSLCMAARDAVDFIGMPEGNLALAQAVVYLSVAPKSNALYTAYGGVQQDVERTAAESVPLHLRNAPTKLMKGLGYGKGYQYAHDLEGKGRRHAVPARQSARPKLLSAHQRRHRKAHSRADGRGQTPALALRRSPPAAAKERIVDSYRGIFTSIIGLWGGAAMAAVPNIFNLETSAKLEAHLRTSAPTSELVEDLQRVQKAARSLGQTMQEAQASLDAAALRELAKERRKLLGTAVGEARLAAEKHGRKISAAVATEVEETLRAATADLAAAAAVESGLLLRGLSADGVDQVDVSDAVALPSALGKLPPPPAPERNTATGRSAPPG